MLLTLLRFVRPRPALSGPGGTLARSEADIAVRSLEGGLLASASLSSCVVGGFLPRLRARQVDE